MAVDLLERSSVFREQMANCEVALAPFVDWSLEGVLRGFDGAPGLERVDVVQPVLFAVMVSLAELWRSCGVRPDAVLGHSQGEIAAAHVAGGLSLEDAARVVAVRSRALSSLAGHGGMVSVSARLDAIGELLEPLGEQVAIAAVNGPSTIAISGEGEALERLLEQCAADGIEAKRIPVDYAAHSSAVESVRSQLLEGCAGIDPRGGEVPFYSTVTEGLLDTAELDGEYWYRNLRDTVKLLPAVHTLIEKGHSTFIEVSPHPVLTVGVQATIDEMQAAAAHVKVLGTLRRGEDGWGSFSAALAHAWVHGVAVQWRAIFASSDAQLAELPTYPFQRERYWLGAPGSETSDLLSVGQLPTDHPLLGAALALPDGEWLFTGRVSLEADQWLSDHVAMGMTLLPATAFLELALQACERLGCNRVVDLALHAPLIISGSASLQLQVRVGALDECGARALSVYSRPQSAPETGLLEGGWTQNASGTLQSGGSPSPALRQDGGQWPPDGATELDVEHLYDVLMGAQLEYGPSFQGLRRAWTLDGEVYGEVSLAESECEQASRYAIHPALLDAALHAGAFMGSSTGEACVGRLPVAFDDVSPGRFGSHSLRVCISPLEDGLISLRAFDDAGKPVVRVGSLAMRAVTREEMLSSRTHDSLFEMDWSPTSIDPLAVNSQEWLAIGSSQRWPAGLWPAEGPQFYSSVRDFIENRERGASIPQVVLAMCPAAEGAQGGSSEQVLEQAHANSKWALELIQQWLAEEEWLGASRLVILTRGALQVRAGERVQGLGEAPVWGLVRAVQAESPNRIVLVDLDDDARSWNALAGALESQEQQMAIRAGRVLAPRLKRVGVAQTHTFPLNAERTVLITGGTSGLGALLARRLVERHGARSLLLASRTGRGAEGVVELEAELTERGAQVGVVACDVSERAQVQRLLDAVPAERPLGAVVHAAGVLDDGLLASLSPERMASVLRPKVDGALHLHELTEELDLSVFALFSSASATLGGAGQANYAAANSFLDALAAHRRSLGLAGTSVAWGLWDTTVGMGGSLTEVDRLRLSAKGLRPMTVNQGLDLFEVALANDQAFVLAMALDMVRLSSRARSQRVPSVLRGLVRATRRPAGDGAFESLAARAMGLADRERERLVLDVTLAHTATVLGHTSSAAVEPARTFKELGFDSLTAVELRNRLADDVGFPLPATLAFDHPTPNAVVRYLLRRLAEQREGAVASLDDELGQLERRLSQIASQEDSRPMVVGLLRSLLAELDSHDRDAVEDVEVASASAVEVLELIDREFGALERHDAVVEPPEVGSPHG